MDLGKCSGHGKHHSCKAKYTHKIIPGHLPIPNYTAPLSGFLFYPQWCGYGSWKCGGHVWAWGETSHNRHARVPLLPSHRAHIPNQWNWYDLLINYKCIVLNMYFIFRFTLNERFSSAADDNWSDPATPGTIYSGVGDITYTPVSSIVNQ